MQDEDFIAHLLNLVTAHPQFLHYSPMFYLLNVLNEYCLFQLKKYTIDFVKYYVTKNHSPKSPLRECQPPNDKSYQ